MPSSPPDLSFLERNHDVAVFPLLTLLDSELTGWGQVGRQQQCNTVDSECCRDDVED